MAKQNFGNIRLRLRRYEHINLDPVACCEYLNYRFRFIKIFLLHRCTDVRAGADVTEILCKMEPLFRKYLCSYEKWQLNRRKIFSYMAQSSNTLVWQLH